MSAGERRKHRSRFSQAMTEAMARIEPEVGAPEQLDLFGGIQAAGACKTGSTAALDGDDRGVDRRGGRTGEHHRLRTGAARPVRPRGAVSKAATGPAEDRAHRLSWQQSPRLSPRVASLRPAEMAHAVVASGPARPGRRARRNSNSLSPEGGTIDDLHVQFFIIPGCQRRDHPPIMVLPANWLVFLGRRSLDPTSSPMLRVAAARAADGGRRHRAVESVSLAG